MSDTIYLVEHANSSVADNPSAYESLDEALDGFEVPLASRPPAAVTYMEVVTWDDPATTGEVRTILVRAVKLNRMKQTGK